MGHALNYVQLSTTFDPPMQAICTLHGAKGYSVLVRTWTACHLQASPELDLSNDLLIQLHAAFCFVTVEELRAILESCFLLDVFDRGEWESRKVLTHRSIVKHLDNALHKRRVDAERKRVKRAEREANAAAQPVQPESDRTTVRKRKSKEREREEKRNTPQESILTKKGEKDAVSPEVAGKIADIIKTTKASLRKESDEQPLTDQEVAARKEQMIQQLNEQTQST